MEDRTNFANTLIRWYEENQRDLPWRHTKDPYRIWISEIVLQQTRVMQGYEYYQRLTERFPDVFALAAADEDEIMKYWQGLGYYSRARHLHEAARSMAAAGGFPTTYEGVRALKGVGDYTAAAICSFAYGMPYAVVDGNVYRVISRWMGVDMPIDSTKGKRLFAALANELLDKQRPALYNQAIMDFGAMQCVPTSPDCMNCPLVDSCVSWQNGTVKFLPFKRNRTKVVTRFFCYIYVRTGTYTWLRKRMDKDIWKKMYEPLLIETEEDLAGKEPLLLQKLQAVLGLSLENFTEGQEIFFKPVGLGLKHVLSHRVIYSNFYELVLPDGIETPEGYLKVPEKDLHKFAVPNLVSRFFSLILKPIN